MPLSGIVPLYWYIIIYLINADDSCISFDNYIFLTYSVYFSWKSCVHAGAWCGGDKERYCIVCNEHPSSNKPPSNFFFHHKSTIFHQVWSIFHLKTLTFLSNIHMKYCIEAIFIKKYPQNHYISIQNSPVINAPFFKNCTTPGHLLQTIRYFQWRNLLYLFVFVTFVWLSLKLNLFYIQTQLTNMSK